MLALRQKLHICTYDRLNFSSDCRWRLLPPAKSGGDRTAAMSTP